MVYRRPDKNQNNIYPVTSALQEMVSRLFDYNLETGEGWEAKAEEDGVGVGW